MQDIIKADIVIGRQTMALVVALKAGKKVFSCIPDNEKRCVIPYKGIVELRDLLKQINDQMLNSWIRKYRFRL